MFSPQKEPVIMGGDRGVSWCCSSRHFTIYACQVIVIDTLKLFSAIFQLHLNKTKNSKQMDKIINT